MEDIRYADCTKDYVCTPDGSKRPAWMPDEDYGNEYAKVHFRIRANGYDYPEYHFSKEDGDAFDKEVAEVFTALGWSCEESYNGRCSTWFNGKSHLYLHPQEFSGEVLKNEIKTVAEAVAKGITFKLTGVDVYKTVYDITDEEYEEILSCKDKEISEALLIKCKTTRTYNYYDAWNIATILAGRFRVARIGNSDGENGGIGQTAKHILTIIEKMAQNGQLITVDRNEQMLVRTPNKTEQRKMKAKTA